MPRGKKKDPVAKPTKKGRKPKSEKESNLTFTFRIADGLGEALKKRAEDEHTSSSSLMNRYLEEGLKSNFKDRLAGLEKRLAKLEAAPKAVALYLGADEGSVMAAFEATYAAQVEQRKVEAAVDVELPVRTKKETVSSASVTTPAPKKRGRPRKTPVVEVVDYSEEDDTSSDIEDIEDLATAQSVSHRETYEADGADDDLRAADV